MEFIALISQDRNQVYDLSCSLLDIVFQEHHPDFVTNERNNKRRRRRSSSDDQAGKLYTQLD